jgi:transposase InsO family protein
MAWRISDVRNQRIHFVVRALQGADPLAALCREFDISRTTGYKWINRYRRVGSVTELDEISRRPHTSPTRTDSAWERRVVALRRRWGWGGKKLQVLLRDEGIDLTVTTINRIIRRHGLVDRSDSHRPALRRFERERPNALWQMDFKGDYATREGRCYPLSLLDDHSRYAVGLFALSERSAKAVWRCLVQTFERHGMPDAMLMDHGAPWWSTTNGHGLTRVTVGLIKQGIGLHFSAVGHPQTQGKVERFHRTLSHALKRDGLPRRHGEWPPRLRSFLAEYNEIRPHEALGMLPPVSRWRASRRPYTARPPEWVYPSGSVVKRLNPSGVLWHGGRQWFVCEALAGERVRLECFASRVLVIYREMLVRELDLASGRTTAVVRPLTDS